ncbi:MerR family transcriptional regulator [Microbacterium sp. NPDC055683]
MKSNGWTIGELAERFGLATHVLRHWEDRGLLSPERDGAGRRRYAEADAYRVAVVLASKAAGMGLEQIRALVDGGAAGRHEVLERRLAEIDESIAALERSRAMARHALECRSHDISTCPGFRANVADIVAGTRRGMAFGAHGRGPAGAGAGA